MMYFVSIFSIAAILGLGFARPGGGLWLAGLAAAVAAIFTMASGFLAAAAVVGLLMLRAVGQRGVSRKWVVAMVAAMAVVVLGLMMKVDVAHHQGMRAHSFMNFF